MTPAAANISAIPEPRPEIVGRYHAQGQTFFLPASGLELIRAAEFYGTILDTFDFAPGRQVLVTAMFEEAVQFAPFEEAVMDAGLVVTNADASAFEASRIESILRRFDVAAVAGVDAAVLDGLEAAGFDVRRLFAGRTIWARPDAFGRLAGSEDVRLRRWVELGPAVALECVAGDGAHLDAREWAVEVEDGTLRLSSRLERCLPFARFDTGVRAELARRPGLSGLAGSRLIFQAD